MDHSVPRRRDLFPGLQLIHGPAAERRSEVNAVAVASDLLRSARVLTHANMSRVTRWKLARGKMRPLQKMVDANSPIAVEEASRNAVAALEGGQVHDALAKLMVLRGVGPATASAVLAAHSPHAVPFMADEAMEAAIGQRDYTDRAFTDFTKVMCTRALALRKLGWTDCSAEAVGRSLWAAAMLAASGKPLTIREKLAAAPELVAPELAAAPEPTAECSQAKRQRTPASTCVLVHGNGTADEGVAKKRKSKP